MTGRLVDMAFTLGGKQRVTLEINGDFREIWDKLHQEPPIIPAMFRSARAFLREVTMISRFWTMPMICRSKEVH